jgi:hypothetical protein
MVLLRRIGARLRSEESGLTLIELLVVMIVAIITTLALFTFQDLALRQTTRVFARVDATQQARGAIEKIESRLHSACVADKITPIQIGSSNTKLVFLSKYGSAASLTPEKHEIELTGGQLIDTTYFSTGVDSDGNYLFGAAATDPPPQVILDNVSAPGGVAFRYYAYGIAKDASNQPYKDAAGNQVTMLLDGTSSLPDNVYTYNGTAVPAGTKPANSPTAIATPITDSTTAGTVSAVRIDLLVGANGNLGNGAPDATKVTVSDSVVLRITPVPSDNNQGIPGPCQ